MLRDTDVLSMPSAASAPARFGRGRSEAGTQEARNLTIRYLGGKLITGGHGSENAPDPLFKNRI